MMGGAEAGGHNGFDTQAEETGLEYLVEEKKKVLQSGGFKGNIQQEALFLSLPIYEKRHEMNEKFWSSELQRETETETQYEIRYNEARKQYEMYHPVYETYLQDMLLRTERYAKEKNHPHVFNKKEADSIVQAERALVSGEATSILYPVWHESGKVRYFSEMTIDGNVINNKYVDVGKLVGKDLSQEEAAKILSDLQNLHNEQSREKDNHASVSQLILKEGEVGFHEIAATAYKNIYDKQKKGDSRSLLEMQKNFDGYMRPAYSVKVADYEGGSFLGVRILGERGLLGTLQLAEQLYKDKIVPFFHPKKMAEGDKTKAKKKSFENKRTNSSLEVAKMDNNISSVEVRTEKQIIQNEEKKKAIVVAEKTGMGIGGALFILNALTEPVKPVTKREKKEMKRIRKEIKRLGDKDIRRSGDKEMRKQRKNEIKKLRNKDAKRVRNTEAQRQRKKEMKKVRQKEKLRTTFPLKEKKKKEIRKELKRTAGSKDVAFFAALAQVTRKIQKESVRSKRYKERKSLSPKERMRISALEFTRAWIVFSLIQTFRQEKQISKKKEVAVVFLETQSSPWVLLAIIWHMTMIREQGKAIILPRKKKKKKKKLSHRLSKQGLIYLYRGLS